MGHQRAEFIFALVLVTYLILFKWTMIHRPLGSVAEGQFKSRINNQTCYIVWSVKLQISRSASTQRRRLESLL